MKRATVNLSDDDYQKLAAMATELDRSISWVIGRAVKDALARSEHDTQYLLDFGAEESDLDTRRARRHRRESEE